ncbi:MAG: efflux RND transporter periplasmic adaptor subunit [Pirellulaceae bacterium]
MSDTKSNSEIDTDTVTEAPAPTANSRRTRLHHAFTWFKLFAQPVIAVAIIALVVFAFGYAQRMGFFTSADSQTTQSAETDDGTEYVCPMLCVPPSKVPGRCPVCAMELQARKVSGDSKDIYGLTIEPAARRLSNIQTAMAASIPLVRQVRALGRIGEDETSQATISAWVDGRLEDLMVDFTGAEVTEGQALAVLYSPELYSAQIELLEAKKAMENETTGRQRIADANRRMYESARQRLLEFGLPESQVAEIERQANPENRIRIVSPISGTVTEKMAVQGDYVSTGTPLFKVVDLSQVWLLLEMFPEEANLIRYGQSVSVTLQSQAGRKFEGRVAFIAPQINTQTQTVSVRVVISNEAGLIRIGDFAQARVYVDVTAGGHVLDQVYDSGLAGKWISPRHPHIVRDEPGQCPLCGDDLVPAVDFGFVATPPERPNSVVVPRSAVLMSGEESVAYVETEPGRFEFRQVETGQVVGEQVAIISGINPGEMVVVSAPFTLDAAFNMAGKPSLIDPTRAIDRDQSHEQASDQQQAAIDKALSELSEADQALVRAQKFCPVADYPLGGMGTPVKVMIEDQPVFLCCDGCRDTLLKDPEPYLAKLQAASADNHPTDENATNDVDGGEPQ